MKLNPAYKPGESEDKLTETGEQRKFREFGAQITGEIEILLNQKKVDVEKISVLVNSWLKMLPGISEYFILQQSKIIVDKVFMLKE